MKEEAEAREKEDNTLLDTMLFAQQRLQEAILNSFGAEAENIDLSNPTEAELLAHAKKSLAHYKIPKRIIFVEDLPRNASGKILKRELRRVHGGEETAVHSGAVAPAG